MEQFLPQFQDILGVPKFLIEQITVLPDYIKQALIESLYFVIPLFFLYFAIELLERFFMAHINILIKLFRKFGAFFGVVISTLPECGFSVIASTYYSRKLITRGTLMAFLIATSDEAYPLLFMDLEKTKVLIPLIIIKIVLGLIVWVIVDSAIIFMKKPTEEVNAVNIDLNETACCHHKLNSYKEVEVGWGHPATHTVNILFFTALALSIYYSAVNYFGSSENLSAFLMYNSPLQIFCCAVFGLIPSCAASVFLAVAYVKGAISFAGLLAGLTSTTGVGLLALVTKSKKNVDNLVITLILFAVAFVVGLTAIKLPVPVVPLFATN